jgi:phosphate starvation-inducible PhoH-like protein
VAKERIPDAREAEMRVLFGPLDRHLRALRERFGVRITVRRDGLHLLGDDPAALREVAGRIRGLLARVRAGGAEPSVEEVESLLLDGEGAGGPHGPRSAGRRTPPGEARGRPAAPGPPRASFRPLGPAHPGVLLPRTRMQERYIRAIREADVVVAIGPAGTGKTFLAVVEAVASLRSGATRRIVLTRPAVEAGEKLGFLPGDFQAKINPYLRPLYDALGEMLSFGELQRYLAADVIEIVPLAYMRGRTLRDAFIILDEAQNTTPAQMKMFLTRIGQGSKVVVNGDVTQVDLPAGTTSGLVQAVGILASVRGIATVRFGQGDIVRHALVQRIVDAYERHEAGERSPRRVADAAPDAEAEEPGRDDERGGAEERGEAGPGPGGPADGEA